VPRTPGSTSLRRLSVEAAAAAGARQTQQRRTLRRPSREAYAADPARAGVPPPPDGRGAQICHLAATVFGTMGWSLAVVSLTFRWRVVSRNNAREWHHTHYYGPDYEDEYEPSEQYNPYETPEYQAMLAFLFLTVILGGFLMLGSLVAMLFLFEGHGQGSWPPPTPLAANILGAGWSLMTALALLYWVYRAEGAYPTLSQVDQLQIAAAFMFAPAAAASFLAGTRSATDQQEMRRALRAEHLTEHSDGSSGPQTRGALSVEMGIERVPSMSPSGPMDALARRQSECLGGLI